MINIILTGCNGAMGKNLVELIEANPDLNVSAGVDRTFNDAYKFKQYTDFNSDDITGDVIIDFSHYTLVPAMLDFIEKTKIPAVICTTGLSQETEERIQELSKSVALFQSGNMSLGINLIISLAQRAAEILGDDFDIEIIEKHHNKKIDSPSGTALMIANGINDSLDNRLQYVYGREGNDTKRKKNDIGIHAVRGGTIVGEHEVIFAGQDEVVSIQHSAGSKKVFAQGAISAAKFLVGKGPGMYDMKDII